MENQIESLTPWLGLDVPMDCEGTGRTAMLLGTMPGEVTLESIYQLIAERCPETEALDVQIILKDKDAAYVVVICMKEEALAVEDALRTGGFARPSQTVDEIPAGRRNSWKPRLKS